MRKPGAGWSSRVSVLRRAGGRMREQEAARRALIACSQDGDERGPLLPSDEENMKVVSGGVRTEGMGMLRDYAV